MEEIYISGEIYREKKSEKVQIIITIERLKRATLPQSGCTKKEILNAKKIEMHRSVWTAVIRIGIKTARIFHNKYTCCSFLAFYK